MRVRTLLAALLLAASPALGATVRETFDRTYALAPEDEVVLRNTNGDIRLESWDRAEIRVEAEKQVRTSSPERAREAMAELEIEVEESPGRLSIRTRHPQGSDGLVSWLFGRSVDTKVTYHVTLPRTVELRATTTNGSIEASEVGGRLDLSSTNGGIEVYDAAGVVEASTTNGRIQVELLEVAEGADLSFDTTNGGITLSLPADVRATVSARTVNGSIETDFPVDVEGRTGRKRLDGDINGGGGRIDLRTTNGSIRLREL